MIENETNKPKGLVLQPSHVKVYNFIVKFKETNVYSPTPSEIAKKVQIHERQVNRLIDALCQLGYLSKQKFFKRSIEVVKSLQ